MRLPAVFGVVTPAGRSLLLVSLVSYVADTVGGWSVFQLLWVACLLMVVVTVALALLPRRARVELIVSPPRTVAGQDAEVVLSCTNDGRLPLPGPLVDVPAGTARHLVRLPTLRRNRVVEDRVGLTGLRRGVIPVGPVTARRSDALGLLRWTERWSAAAELLVLPRMVPVEALGAGVIRDQEGIPSDEISMSDLAFHALREYVPGDELRHVHWRSSAKANKLQIRQYHDTRRSHLTVVVDDNRGSYADPEDFEIAVSVAASIAARADRDGVDLSMLCGEHAVTGRGLDGVLDACCRIELGSSNPAQSTRNALRLAPETSWLVVLTGGAADPALPGVLRAGLPADVALLLVRADGAAATSLSRARGVRMLALGSLDDLPSALEAAMAGTPG
ncbi:MAG: hypothetical protein JWQ67_2044 [Marmoricola sp.]|jgi:uncharacterized protein (DUF58 family)|nr:hypothetical protein [Marmoricola sp.]MCW2828428.1 hypothetical protein [Marmoricola sp.]